MSIKTAASLSLLILSVIVNTAHAALPSVKKKIYQVETQVEFHNESWYPLLEKDMKEAAVDSAFDSLTESGWLRFGNKVKSTQPHGTLIARVTLVEPAETVKTTLKLTLSDEAPYIATASTSIRGLEYQGIYHSFEHVGRMAAERMNAKLTALELMRIINADQGNNKRRSSEIDLNQIALAKQLYDKAQSLKESYNFSDAAIVLEQLVSLNGPSLTEWVELGKDELKYGLPVFESSYWEIKAGSMMANLHYDEVEAYWDKSEQALRIIIAENLDDVERVTTARRKIDKLNLSRRQLENAYRYNVMSNLDHLKFEIINNIAFTGQFPDKKTIEKVIHEFDYNMKIVQYTNNESIRKIILQENRYNLQYLIESKGTQIKAVPL